MIDMELKKYKIDWILRNKIAIGKPPLIEEHFEIIKKKGIKSIFNLCTEKEVPTPKGLLGNLDFYRYPLPDHKVKKKLEEFELTEVIRVTEKLLETGPVFIHCYAAVERSPFVCIAWLVLKEKISFLNAFDHVKESHIETNPIKQHLDLLMSLNI